MDNYDNYAAEALQYAADFCREQRFELFTPEHLLLAMISQEPFVRAVEATGGNVEAIRDVLAVCFAEMDRVPEDENDGTLELSVQMVTVITSARIHADDKEVGVPMLVRVILELEDSYAAEALRSQTGVGIGEFMWHLLNEYGSWDMDESDDEEDDDADVSENTGERREGWHRHVTLITGEGRNPLIGRDDEIERTVRVLCRKDKNNPIHVGHPGVGKTALVYGLARRIAQGDVPERLKDARIYRLDVGDILAGTQYRGDMEKRLKEILEGATAEKGCILYIDEIHTLVGAGAIGGGALDVSNILKPYLEGNDVRFIGSTTYEEYSRHLEQSRGLVRRFQMIDVAEPSVEETLRIVDGLRSGYEEFHSVVYEDDAVEYAVRESARHLHDRYMPDKALDIIDEAGAYRETHPIDGELQTVDKTLMSEVLARMCKVEAEALKEAANTSLIDLERRIASRVFGQEEAVKAVTEAVQMAKAGLTDAGKPLAALLFVGPTGVGKTEVARVLADELGVELVRFDMSEYAEKHTVAKLIGAPAGYVGYDDGGLLTDAIRRTPNCVLLLDEIEKAHSDIYNILLQVMDYARLSDNKGRHADFRNVVVIMTSNAGAQYAAQARVGFGSSVTTGDAMLRQVKRTFKPEFINRLSATVVFSDMTEEMASLILEKKLGELQKLLDARGVTLSLSDEARQSLLKEGFTREYGAREMERVIGRRLKPLLMREILFGRLKDGGKAHVVLRDGELKIITVR